MDLDGYQLLRVTFLCRLVNSGSSTVLPGVLRESRPIPPLLLSNPIRFVIAGAPRDHRAAIDRYPAVAITYSTRQIRAAHQQRLVVSAERIQSKGNSRDSDDPRNKINRVRPSVARQ